MALITLIAGFIIGYISNILAMKINFKQRTIDNKIKVYDSLICKWIEMRNHLYHFDNKAQEKGNKWLEFDRIYGSSQIFIAETFMISDNQNLAENINNFNEKLYR